MSIYGKTFRIKSRIRFTLFVAITIVLAVTLMNTLLGFNSASSLTMQEYQSVEIESGDTLWSIASTYMPSDMDTRHAVYIICELNSISADELQAGQTIQVPVYL